MFIYLKNNGCSSINNDSPGWLFEAAFFRVFAIPSRLSFMYIGDIIKITTQTIFYCKSCILCTAFLTMSCTDANVVIPTKISMSRLYIPSICHITEKRKTCIEILIECVTRCNILGIIIYIPKST